MGKRLSKLLRLEVGFLPFFALLFGVAWLVLGAVGGTLVSNPNQVPAQGPARIPASTR